MAQPTQPVRFRDYVGETGRNEVRRWIWTLPEKAKIRLTTRLQYLQDPLSWSPPQAKSLKGPGMGLWEIRFEVEGVQYRPLVWRGPGRSATILLGAIEKNGRLPRGALSAAQKRKLRAKDDPIRRTTEHDYS